MGKFSISTTIDRPRHEVWQTLADLGSIEVWNPGVVKSYWTSDHREGLGAARHCDLKPFGTLEERATAWDHGERLTIDIHEHTKMPFDRAEADFVLSDEGGGTRVDLHYSYHMKYGPIGRLVDRFAVRKQLIKGLGGLLKGLKRHVEQASA
ncbi:MAG: SRPBCC family protein [Acidimicrobiia bacterium]|nr:SRPBCC family protein [Acidimicrobiia bacterium]